MVVLDAVGSDRAVVVSSYDNGMIAQLFAAARPDRVAGLVLIDSFVCPARTEQTPWMPDPAWWEAEIFPTFRRDWGRSWGFDDVPAASEGEREWYYRMQRACCAPGVILAEERRFWPRQPRTSFPRSRRRRSRFHAAPADRLIRGISGCDRRNTSLIRFPTLASFPSTSTNCSGTRRRARFYARSARSSRLFAASRRPSTDCWPPSCLPTSSTPPLRRQQTAIVNGGTIRERHDALVRSQIARFRGREVKTMGDGFLATFDGPARAVRCAQAIIQGGETLGIEIRAGLHTGEVELDGDDVSGIAVAIGARVGALARPSEVSSRRRSRISPPDPGSSSPTAASTDSRASRTHGASTPPTSLFTAGP